MCGMDLKGLGAFYNQAIPGWNKSEGRLRNEKAVTNSSHESCFDNNSCF